MSLERAVPARRGSLLAEESCHSAGLGQAKLLKDKFPHFRPLSGPRLFFFLFKSCSSFPKSPANDCFRYESRL